MLYSAVARGRWAVSALILVAAAGCSGTSVDLGEGSADGGGSGFAGTWLGSVELMDSSMTQRKALRLELDETGHGTVMFGNAPLAPPTDPNVGYPSQAQADAAEGTGIAPGLYDGILYTASEVTIDGDTLKLAIDAWEAFAAWCALQTPFPDGPAGGYACQHSSWAVRVDRSDGQKRCFATGPETNKEVEVDCLAFWVCGFGGEGCLCTASECTIRAEPERVRFSLNLNSAGAGLNGSMSFDRGSFNIRLQRE